ncbi:MAG: adenylate/guanylate cyclase domain-containing protein [Pseudomonadota bacterium]
MGRAILRFQTFDLLQTAAPREYGTNQVAIVDVDEASIAAKGQWPWDRSKLAELTERLRAAGARAIGFDMVFSEPDRLSPPSYAAKAPELPFAVRGVLAGLEDTDARFAAAIAASPAVLGVSGSVYVSNKAGARDPGAIASLGGDPRPRLFAFPGFLRNLSELEAGAAGIGAFSLTPEPDGVVRRVPAALRSGDKMLPSLAMETLRVGLGARRLALEVDPNSGGITGVRLRGMTLPTDRNGRFWLRYAHHRPDLYHSALDVLSPDFDQSKVRDKFVLVGTSAVGLRDLRMTPLDQSLPGVEVHAQAIDAALTGGLLARPDAMIGFEHLATLLGGGLLIALAPWLTAARAAPIYLGVIGTYGGLAWYGFTRETGGFAFDASYPAMAATLIAAVILCVNFAQAERQKSRIRSAFGQYLSPDLVAQLADDPDRLSLGGESREMTFLFCDIAGFTSFVERADPQLLVRLLNEYLDGVCRIVMENGGTVDKIVGDAVHAMFNAPLDDPDHGPNAVRAALEIEAFVSAFREAKRAEGVDFGETRIGVNAGRAVVGNFGGAQRFDYTAHGDAINTAARLEGANKHLGTSIIISESVVRHCAERAPELRFRPIGELFLKGKEQPVGCFEPVRPGGEAQAAAYAEAYALLAVEPASDDDTAAQDAFDDLARRAPEDALARLHAQRLSKGERGVAIVMSEK